MFGLPSILAVFTVFYCFGLATPQTFHHDDDGAINANHFKRQISMMRRAVDRALTNYISVEMGCTNLEACRRPITSLRLSVLPTHVFKRRGNQNWMETFGKSLDGLQVFNYYLYHVFKYAEGNMPGTAAISLHEVSVLLQQFIPSFKYYMEDTHCLQINFREINDYPDCGICSQYSLPSKSLEVVRNYYFMMQFYEYLGDFHNNFNKFLSHVHHLHYC
ncbi:uncharacterized protein LOC143468855 isoform X1 [Clavelina lepadiformis]|uniref:uncharacterized protein LOC143468855 isoform X1 n=2 Tax=Clavelina lepadiformis TaxID=159417 RepID=UPI004041494E